MVTEQYFFHPQYDGHVHVNFKNTDPVGTEFIGPMGLLSRLELKLGITRAEMPEYVREQSYRDAIANTNLSVFGRSYQLDPANVAKQLLAWRDALVMAGWDFKCDNSASALLKDFAAIEKYYDKSILGIADRWIEVKNKISSLQGKINITACCTEGQIHPTIASILKQIKAQFSPLKKEVNKNITAYKFTDAYDAYLAAAVKLDPKTDVVVCQNDKAFNDVLKRVGHTSIETNLEDVNSQVVQLFKILLLLFVEPNNLRNIVSYLTTRPCPIEKGGELGNYLLQHCGWGDKDAWDKFVACKNKDGKPLVKDDGTSFYDGKVFEDFRNFIESIGKTNKGGVIKKKVDELFEASKKFSNIPIVRAQLSTIREFCRQFYAIIDEEHDYTSDEIRAIVDQIYSTGSYKLDSATTESFFTYPSLECIYDTAERVVWVDCYGELTADYDYDFLSVADVTYLKLPIWKTTDQVAAKVALLSAATQHAGKEVVLFVPQNSQGERVKQSPVLTDLAIQFSSIKGSAFDLKIAKTPDVVQFASSPKTLYYEIPDNVTVAHREKESYSSLDSLINYPFDYVMKYACGLYAPEIGQLDGLNRIMGTVAHKTFENLNNEFGVDYDKMQNAVSQNFEEKITAAATQCGIVLFLPENKFVFDAFKRDLVKSFTNLINILKNNNLTIVGTEKDYEVDNFFGLKSTQDNKLTAQIDLVLKDAEKKILIFDLKYGKPSTYQEKLEKNKALQLDIYKYCVENDTRGNKAPVKMVGYFNLKEGRLFTCDTSLQNDANIVIVAFSKDALTGNVIDLVRNSYNYRFEEFNTNKKLEEAEGLLVKGATAIEYSQSILNGTWEMYPLVEKSGKKKENNYSDYKLLKGESKK